jgi:CRP-like cAMP-binding protein
MEWKTYKPGDVIFREGEQSSAAYLIVSGNVRIVKDLDTTNPKELAVVGAGEYVGEMGAIDDQPRSASAVAQDTVVCMPVTPAEFMDMLIKNPDEAIDLLKILFERLRAANKRLVQFEQAGAG